MRLVIVGGVAGGMSCAARARRLDEQAEIIVLERGQHVSFANCGLPYLVGGEIAAPKSLLVQTPESLRAVLNLDVRVGHNVTGLDAAARQVTVQTAAGSEQIAYDTLVLAPGAKAARPPIPGLDSPRVRSLRTVEDGIVLRSRADAGLKRAVVLGAGFVGVETAEALARRGVDVTLVEPADHILAPLDPDMAHLAAEELARLGVDVRVRVAAERITAGEHADTVWLSDGVKAPADLTVLAAGVRPDTAVFEAAGVACERGAILVDDHGRTSLEGVWAVGDAVASIDAVTGVRRPIALAGPANRAGRLVADHIFRPDSARPIPPPLGTAVIRVGSLTAALTGASRAALTQAGLAFRTIRLHPDQHAGYFPGAAQLHLAVHVDPDTGRILGAQGVGADGVDKRIDVLATAIRAGWSVDQLIDLDLAYAPPYGQAKDPVNLAGMIGANLLDGTLALWEAEDLGQVQASALVLDVRGPAEVAADPLDGALAIPLAELRDRLDELRRAAGGHPVRAICASGLRSATAHRLLTQSGFDSASLSGGLRTLRAVLGSGATRARTVPAGRAGGTLPLAPAPQATSANPAANAPAEPAAPIPKEPHPL
ncbi:MAG: FAD-dependent oxidoreductase [Bifidobacteriaceae bacterium]|jgi:NADPH-dependent 2,4-dienoyl-CoA reductase/sulfur reductase-like enzyme/rhodanese-related sulfurtransferase|nr:FAD-dependent oxidoreductase [Bifidobacteriaceae bacterium]